MVATHRFIRERYRLEEKIASGGMGTVYRAVDEKLGRTVAVKVLAPNLAEDAQFVERFRREARAAAGLSHPNVASVFDAGDEDGTHFIVMELVEGRDLARVLREEGPLEPARTVKIVGQICLALSHAHSAGIVHRDVKPANAIVDDKDNVKVTDFGIARATDDAKLTMTGSVLGSAHYISPEQANGQELGPRSDIYSLGIVTFECLTGALPFTGESLMAVAMRHVSEEVPRPSTINPSVPPELDDVVRRATSKEPSDRYGDAEEMEVALLASLRGDPVTTVLSQGSTDTAVLTPASIPPGEHTVWPIPGNRWEPESLGRKVVALFALLGIVALGLLVWRLTSNDDLAGRARRPPARTVEESVENLTVPSFVIGTDAVTVQQSLEEEGFLTEIVTFEGHDLDDYLKENAISKDSVDPGDVIGTDPPAGGAVDEGQTITLFVAADDSSKDNGEPHGKAKGHEDKDD